MVVLVPLIKSKTTLSQQLLIQSLINIAVYGAEQIFSGQGMGAEKFKYVINNIENELGKRHIFYDIAALKLIVESEVKKLNIQQNKI